MIYPRTTFLFFAVAYIVWRYHSLLLQLSGRLPDFSTALRLILVGILPDGDGTIDIDSNVAQLVSAFDANSERPDIVSPYFRSGHPNVLLRSREAHDLPSTIFGVTWHQVERAPALHKRIFRNVKFRSSSSAVPLKLQMAESAAVLELFLRFVIGNAADTAAAARLCDSYNMASFTLLLAIYDCAWNLRCTVLVIQLEEQLW